MTPGELDESTGEETIEPWHPGARLTDADFDKLDSRLRAFDESLISDDPPRFPILHEIVACAAENIASLRSTLSARDEQILLMRDEIRTNVYAGWLAQMVIDKLGGTNDLDGWVLKSAEYYRQAIERADKAVAVLPALDERIAALETEIIAKDAEIARHDGVLARLREETAIVDRIWSQFGSPSFEELRGRSIYDLIEEQRARAETAEALLLECRKDAERLDWLAGELDREQQVLRAGGHIEFYSIFRRNEPITRDAIDAAMVLAHPPAEEGK